MSNTRFPVDDIDNVERKLDGFIGTAELPVDRYIWRWMAMEIPPHKRIPYTRVRTGASRATPKTRKP